jgi:cysteine desulfurase/selenocysteine lyase
MGVGAARRDFARARQGGYLDTAAEGLPPDASVRALEAYFHDKSSGSPGRRRMYEMERTARDAAARLLGAAPDRVALVSSASEALDLLAAAIPWQPGDEVLISDLEFPSNVVVWLGLRARGVQVRVLRSEGGKLSLGDYVEAIGPRTRLVSISQVSYKTGAAVPFLPELGARVREAGALLCVDATQALGRIPVPVDAADYLVASSYKWLLGSHGLGVVYASGRLEESHMPSAPGWYALREIFTPDRFERFEYKPGAARLVAGMPNFPAIYALREGLDYLLGAGVASIDDGLRQLVARLRAGLAARGFDLLTPDGPEYASGIVAFAHPRAQEAGAALEREGVVVWAGDGRVRASVHLYNDESDIDALLTAVDRAAAGAGTARG